MKSLEIVNSWALDVHEKRLKLISNGGSKEDIILSSQIDKLLRIRKDLEVLEIIKNKEVDWQFIRFLLVKEDNLEEVLETYNYSGFHQLTMEELLKLKQWLEEQE